MKDNLFIVVAIILAGIIISGAIIYKGDDNINNINTVPIAGKR